MATSETGHAKNVANFETLNSFCTGYGASYNPNNNSIKVTSLNTLLLNSQNSLKSVNNAFTASSNTIAAREIAFAPLSKLVTRVVNALAASGVPKQITDNARTIARKLQGKRANPKIVPPPADTRRLPPETLLLISPLLK